jgi:hypothetical protein
MNAKTTLLVLLATPIVIYLVAFAIYLSNPLSFHFRAWEFFDIFVYNGFYGRHHHLIETGDSSRDYLFQRYFAANDVSVNEFGNRIACYDPSSAAKPRVLVLGDSNLFASGTDDQATFSSRLCRLYRANVYNGSRRNELSLLRVESLRFDAILFTTTERIPLADKYCGEFKQFAAEYDRKIPDRDIRLPDASPVSLVKMLYGANEFLMGYMKSRLHTLFNAILHGLLAPPGHIIMESHRYQRIAAVVEREVVCARKLTAFFGARGIAVGFLYFPSHQTIYRQEADFAVDDNTASFIDRMSERLAEAGLRTMNTKACLNEAKSRTLVFQMHDTHLNADGYESLAKCLGRSNLSALVALDPIDDGR